MKRHDRRRRRTGPVLRRGWAKFGAIMYGPVRSPSGDGGGALIGMGPDGRFHVMGVGFPKATLESGDSSMQRFFDAHSHAVIAEGVVSLKKAQLLGEAWALKFRRGLVLTPCACEDMTEPVELGPGSPPLAYRMALTYGMRPNPSRLGDALGADKLPSGTRFACGPYVGPTRDTVLADANGNPPPSLPMRRYAIPAVGAGAR
jgi:hypothetical protein